MSKLDFDQYQFEAAKTDKAMTDEGLTIPLLGLAGETGSLHTLYKKYLRDGDAYQIIDKRIAEELGDILWYVATIARRAKLKLSDVAEMNLRKTRSRWLENIQGITLLDDSFPISEQLPRTFTAEIRDFADGNRHKEELVIDGSKAGDYLTDNAYHDDGYRFHDIFHLSYAVMLGWSPVLRANLGRKRKSRPDVDEVEDGGRAIAIEEGISALIFTYAQKHSFLDGVSTIDWPILRTCQEMTSGLEVSCRSLYEWEKAIFAGYRAWRQVRDQGGGFLRCDLERRSFEYVGALAPAASELTRN